MLMCRVRIQGLGFRTWGLGFQSLSPDGAYSFFLSAEAQKRRLKIRPGCYKACLDGFTFFLNIGELGTIAKV